MILLFNSYTPNLFEKNQHFNSYCYKTVNFFCNLCLLVHMQDLIMTCKYSILSPQDLFSESGNLVCLSLIPMQPLSETVCPCFLPKPPQAWLTLGRLSQALTPTPLLKHCQPVLGAVDREQQALIKSPQYHCSFLSKALAYYKHLRMASLCICVIIFLSHLFQPFCPHGWFFIFRQPSLQLFSLIPTSLNISSSSLMISFLVWWLAYINTHSQFKV